MEVVPSDSWCFSWMGSWFQDYVDGCFLPYLQQRWQNLKIWWFLSKEDLPAYPETQQRQNLVTKPQNADIFGCPNHSSKVAARKSCLDVTWAVALLTWTAVVWNCLCRGGRRGLCFEASQQWVRWKLSGSPPKPWNITLVLIAAFVLMWVFCCVLFLKQQGKTDLLLSSFAAAPRALNITRKLVRNIFLSCWCC